MTITYTEGLCGDGAAILRDGVPMSVSEILDALNAAAAREAVPVVWWTGPEPTPTGEREGFHDHETGSHSIPLYTAPPAPAVPPGYKLAPNEPTESMVIDGFESDAFLSLVGAVIEKKGWPYGCEEAAECVTGIFKAMIARIPAAPEVSQ